jgi:hypothetical protein
MIVSEREQYGAGGTGATPSSFKLGASPMDARSRAVRARPARVHLHHGDRLAGEALSRA